MIKITQFCKDYILAEYSSGVEGQGKERCANRGMQRAKTEALHVVDCMYPLDEVH